jgi:hypothetical protein
VVRHIELVRCKTSGVTAGGVVVDKFIDSLVMSECDLSACTEGLGANFIVLDKGTIVRGRLDVGPRNLILDGVVLSCMNADGSTIGSSQGNSYVNLVDVRSARIVPNATSKGLISGGVIVSFTVASVNSGTEVLCSFTNDATAENYWKRLAKEAVYKTSDGSKIVKITNIYQYDATHVAIDGEFSQLPIAGEIYYSGSTRMIKIGKVEIETASAPGVLFQSSFNSNADRIDVASRDDRHFYMTFTDADLGRPASGAASAIDQWIVRARLMRVWVFVDVAYTGATGACLLNITNAALNPRQQINLKTAGAREMTTFAINGNVTGDVMSATAAAYIETLEIFVGSAGSFPAYTSALDLAKFRIVLEFVQV